MKQAHRRKTLDSTRKYTLKQYPVLRSPYVSSRLARPSHNDDIVSKVILQPLNSCIYEE